MLGTVDGKFGKLRVPVEDLAQSAVAKDGDNEEIAQDRCCDGCDDKLSQGPSPGDARQKQANERTPNALRNLTDHAAVHLNVEWRDLPDEKWSNLVKTAQGRTVPASETAWMRTREVWLHAVTLTTPDAVTVAGTLTTFLAWAAGRGTITNAPTAPAWI